MNKSIEETHPSVPVTREFYCDTNKTISETIRVEDVQKHTIDRAVLREAIERICAHTGALHTLNLIKKELELEEE